MIRNAVLHLNNEQPLLADLPTAPQPGDAVLICTNLRTLDGKRPFFVDSSASTFVFPLVHLRFVEVPGAIAAPTPRADAAAGQPADVLPPPALPASVAADEPPEADDLELDEDLLRRVREL